MIISETKEFVFIHNPKCGGTTVRNALLPYDTTGNFFWLYAEFDERKIDKAHMPMHIFRKLYPEYFERLGSSFVFMLVRDPYGRAVSSFNENFPDTAKAVQQAEDKALALKTYSNAVNDYIAKLQPKNLSGWSFPFRHWVRQRDMAYLGHKNMVDLAVKLDDWKSGINRFSAFNPLLRQALVTAGEHNVKTVSVAPMEILTLASVKKINEVYREDFLIFDYPMA